MTSNLDRKPNKKSSIVWAVYNWGNLVCVFHQRKYAVEHARDNCPSDCKWQDVYEVRKVRVTPLS